MKPERYVRVIMPRQYTLRIAIAVAYRLRLPRPFTYVATR